MPSAPTSGQPTSAGSNPEPTRAQRVAGWLGLCTVPLIWLLHLALGVTLVSTACADAVTRDPMPGWHGTQWILGIASVCALVPALAITYAADRAWRKIAYVAKEKRDARRFIAWCGATTSVAFTFGLAFSICVLIAVPIERLCTAFD